MASQIGRVGGWKRFMGVLGVVLLGIIVAALFSPAAEAKMTLKDKVGEKEIKLQIYGFSQFEVRGGNLVIEAMTVERLTEISDEFDDIFIAAGKGDLGNLFGRNEERPHYQRPQRKLCMMITEHIVDWQQRSHVNNPVKFNFYADCGEMFFVPYLHKSGRECYNILFEAKEGSYMDVFDKSMSAEELNATARDWLREYAPWDAAKVEHKAGANPNVQLLLEALLARCHRELGSALHSGSMNR